MSTIDGNLPQLLRWHDIVGLGGIILVVGVLFLALGKSTLPELVNAIGLAFIIFGFIHLFVGLFSESIGQFCQRSLEHTARLAWVP